jgi:endonuclease III
MSLTNETNRTRSWNKPKIRQIAERLKIYGESRHNNRDDVVEELIFIVLSAQTESYSYIPAFENLLERFPNLDLISETEEAEIARVIRKGGLANKKAAQIKAAIRKIKDDNGSLSLDFLASRSDKKALDYLVSIPGIGYKSAACIMMYSLGRKVFPVDTHIWRICRRLELAPAAPKPTILQQQQLETKIPRDIRYSLHVNMLSHGRETCTTYRPKCDKCVLSDICSSRGRPDEVWINWRRPKGVWATA